MYPYSKSARTISRKLKTHVNPNFHRLNTPFESEWLGDRDEDHTTTSRFMLEGGIQAMEIRVDVSLKLSTNRSR